MNTDANRLGALCLTRLPGELITIGDSVTVEVVSVNDGKVKLRIVAPRDVSIMRKELGSQRRPLG